MNTQDTSPSFLIRADEFVVTYQGLQKRPEMRRAFLQWCEANGKRKSTESDFVSAFAAFERRPVR